MAQNSPADEQILAILATLQATLGEDFDQLDPAEMIKVRAILEHEETLVRMAKYEEAKGLFWAHWRGMILGAGAVVSAALFLWTNAERLGLKILGLFQ